MGNRLLVVDGEPRSQRVLDVTLRAAGFQVDAVGDGMSAWSALQNASYDLLIAAADLPDLPGLDGLELCRRIRAWPPASELPILVLTASAARDEKLRALEAGADDVLTKPAYLKELTARVRGLLQRRAREALDRTDDAVPSTMAPQRSGGASAAVFAGDLSEIGVVDLVQLIETKGRSGIAHLHGPTGGATAFLYFRDGKVIDAEAGRLSGLDALARAFSWTSGTFEMEWKTVRRRDALERAPADLVYEGMQRLDAWNELRAQLGDPNVVFVVDYRLLAERLAEIPDEVNAILRLCDGVRTVLQVVEDASMSDTEALTALLRLREEGIVHDRSDISAPNSGVPSTRLDGWLQATTSPFSTAASRARPSAASEFAPTPAVEPFENPVPEPEAPRRTAPGLGRIVPPDEASSAAGAPAPLSAVDEQSGRQPEADNVIPFPSPAPSAPGQGASAIPDVAKPTLVGFEPAAAPDAAQLAMMSMTLPLGRAQLLAGGPGAEGGIAESEIDDELALWAETAAPSGAASMTETQRGVGPLPLLDLARPPPPVEVDADRGDAEEHARSGPAFLGGDEPAVEPPAAPLPSASERGTAREAGAAMREAATAPAPAPAEAARADATAKISIPDEELSRTAALDELGLPSRGRGLRVMAAALAFGALAAVGLQQLLKSRARHALDERAPSVAGGEPAADGERTPPVGPEGRAAPAQPSRSLPPQPPPVELPAPAAAEQAQAGGAAPQPGAATTRPAAGQGEDEGAARPAAEHPDTGAAGQLAPGPSPAIAQLPAPPHPGAGAGAAPSPAGASAPPEDPAARAELARCRAAFARNRLRDAQTACTAAVAANPQSAEALNMLAHVELNRGHLARAQELAQQAVALDPRAPDAYVIIGGALQDSGRNREAKAAYRRYLELAPRGRYADDLRSIINGL